MREVEVLIVGGGVSGLACSSLLSVQGISSYLVSKYPETSRLPKAHLLYSKTMEILRELGIEGAVRERATPNENWQYSGWYAGLAGHDPDAGREIARLESWGGGGLDDSWRAASETLPANIMQAQLEPVMRARAEALAPDAVRFNHNFLSLKQDQAGVIATIEDRASREIYDVRCRYLLGCDGGRAVGPQVGIELTGAAAIATNISVHFSADLSQWATDSQVLLRALLNPEVGTPRVLVPMGPRAWGPASEEWVYHLISFPGDHRVMDDEAVVEDMKRVLGLPSLQANIQSINRWPLDALVADRYRQECVFVLGDAAHRMPPTGGHGLNTAVQDCYNLCWKLGLVLKGEAGVELLETYEAERRPIGVAIVDRAMTNWGNHAQMPRAIGFAAQNKPDENWRNLKRVWADGDEGEAARRRVREALAALLPTYSHLNDCFGYTYAEGALIPDGTPEPKPLDTVHVYQPSTRPGASVPHAWLEDHHGRIAVGDLVANGRFALIASDEGDAWCDAARLVAGRRSIPLTAFTIGNRHGDLLDLRYAWLRQRGIGPSGAILVRPDRFVAWRADELASDPVAELEKVFTNLLSSPKLGRPYRSSTDTRQLAKSTPFKERHHDGY